MLFDRTGLRVHRYDSRAVEGAAPSYKNNKETGCRFSVINPDLDVVIGCFRKSGKPSVALWHGSLAVGSVSFSFIDSAVLIIIKFALWTGNYFLINRPATQSFIRKLDGYNFIEGAEFWR